MTMTYEQYREKRQNDFNALPVFYAFSNEQFEEGMKKLGLKPTDTDKVYKLGYGGFYRKEDSPLIKAWCDSDELPELMKEYSFCKSAVLYEMQNHEYGINWQADWDVMSCFGNVKYTDAADELETYWDSLHWDDSQRRAYMDARRDYFRLAEENDWF